MDLAVWVAQERVVGLLDLIDMLPSNSLLNEAIMNDPEATELLAEQYLNREDSDEEPDNSPRIAEFGLTNRQLAELTDKVTVLIQAVVAGAGGKPKAEKPTPRPRTGIEKAIAEAERKWATDFIQQFGFSPDDI